MLRVRSQAIPYILKVLAGLRPSLGSVSDADKVFHSIATPVPHSRVASAICDQGNTLEVHLIVVEVSVWAKYIFCDAGPQFPSM